MNLCEAVFCFQINALGTLLATVFPAFLPRCYRYVEEGCRVLTSSIHEKFMLVSLDGSMRCVEDCNGNCVNRLGVPIGTMALEIKCPFSAIANKMLMPVNYECPHYYASQVLGEMKVLDGLRTMVVSCSLESLTMCYIDWNMELWQKLWQLALEFYDVQNPSLPTQVHPQLRDLRSLLKEFVHANSVIAVEVPTLECIDSKAYEKFKSDHSEFYRYRDKYPRLNVDVDEVRECVLNCCEASLCAITEAHDLERRKATEVLLFLLTDTDRAYNKDKPHAVPVAYALKGRSLKSSTARQMVTHVREFLHRNKINVLVEAYDGQWAL